MLISHCLFLCHHVCVSVCVFSICVCVCPSLCVCFCVTQCQFSRMSCHDGIGHESQTACGPLQIHNHFNIGESFPASLSVCLAPLDTWSICPSLSLPHCHSLIYGALALSQTDKISQTHARSHKHSLTLSHTDNHRLSQ